MHILYVEDQVDEQGPVAQLFRAQQHQVTVIENVFGALDYINRYQPDILLCDYALGDGPNGLFVAENTRNRYSACTIIMISCYMTVDNTLKAMQIGANDFIRRPIDLNSLQERVWAAVTRHQQRYGHVQPLLARTGPLYIDRERWIATWNNCPLNLTPSEFSLLAHLTERVGQVQNFTALWLAMRGEANPHTDARELIKPHVARLRVKLQRAGAPEDVIQNVRGVGFVWKL